MQSVFLTVTPVLLLCFAVPWLFFGGGVFLQGTNGTYIFNAFVAAGKDLVKNKQSSGGQKTGCGCTSSIMSVQLTSQVLVLKVRI